MSVARTIEAVQRLRPQFDRLPAVNVDADLDYFLTVVSNRDVVVRPHVLVIELPDGRELRVVARLEVQRNKRMTLRPRQLLYVSFGGVVGVESQSDCEVAIRALRSALANRQADAVVLQQLDPHGALYRAARSGAPWFQVDHAPSRNVHWSVGIPDSFDAYLGSRGRTTRRKLRQYRKGLNRAHPDEITIRCFSGPGQLDRLCSDMESISAQTYQRGLGVGYIGDTMQRELLKLAAERGWLRACVLYVANVPAAFICGYCYRKTFYASFTSYDAAYRHLHAGLCVHLAMMERLCGEDGVDLWDYGPGDAEYKRRLCARRDDEAEVLLFAPSLKAASYNVSRCLRVMTIRLARLWISRTKSGGRVKKAWRSRLARRARSQDAARDGNAKV